MKTVTIFLLLLGFALTAFSQSPQLKKELDKKDAETAEEITTQFSVPAIPALNFISSDPSDISRPSDIKELAASLYNGIDENGNVKQGLAIEAALSEMVPIKIDPEDYRNNGIKYMLYNTQFSLGSIATSGDSASTDLGWGVRITLFDKADPMTNRDYIDEFESILLGCGPKKPGETVSDDKLKDCVLNADRPIAKNFAEERWNARWLTVAYAGGSRLKGSELSEGETLGHQVWASGGFPFKNWGQISYLAKWSREFNEETSMDIEEFEIGTKLLVGTKSYNLFAEASYNPLLNESDLEMNEMIETDEAFSWLVGVEFKITDGIWVVTGLGEEAQRIVGTDGIQLLSGIRMGISDKSRIEKK